jgi:broad specificity phosphatase PhoE
MTNQDHSLVVYLVRHAESRSNGQNRIQGHSDSGLTPRGIRQSERVAQRLKSTKIQKIYTSDLGRALKTSKTIAKALGQEVHKHSQLREIRLGEWEGLSVDEVNHQYNQGYDRWLISPTNMVIPGAESIIEFHRRVRGFFDELCKLHPSGTILVVTHGGVIASLISHWLKADFDQTLLNLRVDNTGVTVVEKSPARIKIHSLNEVSHLGGDDLSQKNIFTNR